MTKAVSTMSLKQEFILTANINLALSPIFISSIGRHVQSLQMSQSVGRVLCVFQHSAYLQFDDRLVCLALNDLGAGPITVLLPKQLITLPPCVKQGVKVRFTLSGLEFESGQTLVLKDARIHNAEIDNNTLPALAFNSVLCVIHALSLPKQGLSRLILLFNDGNHGVSGKDQHDAYCLRGAKSKPSNQLTTEFEDVDKALMDYVMPALEPLFGQITTFTRLSKDENYTAEFSFNTQEITKLLGVGPGLTPSGDDFLSGVFTCLYLKRQRQCANRLWAALRVDAYQKTTAISFVLLSLAAENQHCERLQRLVLSLLRFPSSSHKTIENLLNSIGNTSGWDWLAGFLLCLQAVEQGECHFKHSR